MSTMAAFQCTTKHQMTPITRHCQVTLKKDNQKLASGTETIPRDLLRLVINSKKEERVLERLEKLNQRTMQTLKLMKKIKKNFKSKDCFLLAHCPTINRRTMCRSCATYSMHGSKTLGMSCAQTESHCGNRMSGKRATTATGAAPPSPRVWPVSSLRPQMASIHALQGVANKGSTTAKSQGKLSHNDIWKPFVTTGVSDNKNME